MKEQEIVATFVQNGKAAQRENARSRSRQFQVKITQIDQCAVDAVRAHRTTVTAKLLNPTVLQTRRDRSVHQIILVQNVEYTQPSCARMHLAS